MSRIISEPVDRESVEFSLFFENPESKGSGYSFDSDEAGNVDAEKLNEVARANFERMLAGDWPRDVRRFESHWREPAVIECDCGTHLELYSSWANSCQRCGREYNGSGQLLAPRSQWGEETGERF
jgi:hypothetical protein